MERQTGRYDRREEELDAQKRDWLERLQAVRTSLEGFPEEMVNDAGLGVMFVSPTGEGVRAYPLSDSNGELQGLIDDRLLLVGVQQNGEGTARGLYELGPSRVTLDERGVPLRKNPSALHALELEKLTPDELSRAAKLLQLNGELIKAASEQT